MLAPFAKYVDVKYSLDVLEKLRTFESNKDLGYRLSGSDAELEAAEFLYNEFKKIGLQNVRKEKVTVDTFEFKHANLMFKDAAGNEQKVILSAYQTNCHFDNEPVEIVYVNKGRDIDYEGIDVKDKIVLFDINMIDEWWINWPVFQAKVKGVKGMISVNTGGYCSYSEDTLGSQDVSAPADTPAFSMSVKDANVLKEVLKANDNKITAVLDADATVENDGFCYDVIGEIPGEIDEVIYLIGHYDAYFRAFDDNTGGTACILGIVKAFCESGYKPRRTLRVICHGSEEWGIENTRYDWARGATVLTWNHPEWKENGFLLVNLDGNTLDSTATGIKVRTPFEMAKGVQAIGENIDGCLHPFGTNSPLWTWTESYMYDVLGIPSIESFYEGVDFWGSYHSTKDLKEVNSYTDEEYRSSHILYGSFLQEFDKLNVRPLNFVDMLTPMMESVDEKLVEDAPALKAAIAKAIEAAAELKKKNDSEMTADEVLSYNKKIGKIFAFVTNELFGLDWYENYDFVHVHKMHNIGYLKETIACLEKGDIAAALDEHLRSVDLAWYGYHFDYETYNKVIDQVIGKDAVKTWANGKVTTHADLWQPARSLMKKREEKDPDVSAEIEALKKELAVQKTELKAVVKKQISDIEKLTEMMEDACR